MEDVDDRAYGDDLVVVGNLVDQTVEVLEVSGQDGRLRCTKSRWNQVKGRWWRQEQGATALSFLFFPLAPAACDSTRLTSAGLAAMRNGVEPAPTLGLCINGPSKDGEKDRLLVNGTAV